MNSRYEQSRTNAAHKSEESLDLLRNQMRTQDRYEQQRAPLRKKNDTQLSPTERVKNDAPSPLSAAERVKNDAPAPLSDDELQQKIAIDIHNYQQELLTTAEQRQELYKQRPDTTTNVVMQKYAEQSDRVIQDNRAESAEKEPLFQAARTEAKRLLQAHTQLEKQVKETEAYQNLLEKEKDTTYHFNSTTHTLAAQLTLLDTAITSLQENITLKQSELQETPTSTSDHEHQTRVTQEIQALQQKHTELSTQKGHLENEKYLNGFRDTQVPAMRTEMVAVQATLDKQQNDLKIIDKQLAETEKLRARLQIRDAEPQVVQKFSEHLAMVKANVRYLELELGQKQNRRQELQERATAQAMLGRDDEHKHTQAEIAQLDAEEPSLQDKLTTEKAYLGSLEAQKNARAKENIQVTIYMHEELQRIDHDIPILEKIINADIAARENMLKSSQPQSTEAKDITATPEVARNIQEIEERLTARRGLLQMLIGDRDWYKDKVKKDAEIKISPEIDRHGVFTEQELQNQQSNPTLEVNAEYHRVNLANHMFFLQYEKDTLNQTLVEKRAPLATYDGDRVLQEHALAQKSALQPTENQLQTQLTEVEAQLQTVKNKQETLTKFRDAYATNIVVNRSLDEQTAMVQNLQRLHEQHEPDQARLDMLDNYQEKLAGMRQRADAQQTHRKLALPLDKQMALVKEHIALLQADDDTHKIAIDALVAEANNTMQKKYVLGDDFKNQMDTLVRQSNTLINAREKSKALLATEKNYLQQLESIQTSPRASMQTMVTRNPKQQSTMLDNLIKHKKTQRDTVQTQLDASQLRKDTIEQDIKRTSSDYIQVHLKLDAQRELVALNLQHLRTKSEQSTTKLRAKEAERDTLRTRLADLGYSNDNLADHSLSNAFEQIDKWQFQVWTRFKSFLQADIQTLQHDTSDEGKAKLSKIQERLQAVEQLEQTIQAVKKQDQEALNTWQKQEWSYVEKLEQHRDLLRVMGQNIEASLLMQNERYTALSAKREFYRLKYIHSLQFYTPKKVALGEIANHKMKKLDRKLAIMHKQTLALQKEREIVYQLNQEITSHHAILKDIAEKKRENTHSYFLNEHMISEDLLIKFGFTPPSGSQIFAGTTESACLPTAIRMIRHDLDPSFADKAQETAAALHTMGDGGAFITDVPAALKTLGHPIPYELAKLDSMHQILDKVTFDEHGKSLPMILFVQRPEKPLMAKHFIVCNGIVDINGHKYAVLRDSNRPKSFAVRLDHIDEVLTKHYAIDPVSGQQAKNPVNMQINVAYPVLNKNPAPLAN